MKQEKNNQEGRLVWITGLPGTGKTILGEKIYSLVRDIVPAIRVDGDVFREIMGGDLGYSMADRKANAFRIVRMNKYLVEHGMTVICATVSLFKEVHDWNREHISDLTEVYIEVPQTLHKERDYKGFYRQTAKGEIQNVIGIDQPFDKPQNPHITIINDGTLENFLKNAHKIAQQLLSRQ